MNIARIASLALFTGLASTGCSIMPEEFGMDGSPAYTQESKEPVILPSSGSQTGRADVGIPAYTQPNISQGTTSQQLPPQAPAQTRSTQSLPPQQHQQPAAIPQPPPLRIESVSPPPRPDYKWVPGAWEWLQGQWIWFRGRWERPPRPAAIWIPGQWMTRDGSTVWINGHWR